MQGREDLKRQQMAGWNVFQKWNPAPLAVLLLGIVSITMNIYENSITEKQRQNYAVANALMGLQFHFTASHLWFEEALNGDKSIDVQEVWAGFDRGIHLAETIMEGGEDEHDMPIRPTDDPRIRRDTETVRELMVRLKTGALERWVKFVGAGTGSELDQEFDAVFDELMKETKALETYVEMDIISNHGKSERLFLIILLAWASMVGAAAIGLQSRESRRALSEKAIQNAHQQLESQTEELMNHRLRLMELVDERTAELATANRELQAEVTERKRVQAVLSKSEERFRSLVTATSQMVWTTDPKGEAVDDLPTWREFTGQSEEETKGWGWSKALHPEDRRQAVEVWNQAVQSQTPYETEYRVRRYDGEYHHFAVRGVPILEEDGSTREWVGTCTDITEKMTIQKESMRLGHLASIGELAAGVAHEINNPVNGIINYARILLDEGIEGGDSHDILSRIIKEGDRIATIVRSLLTFAHQDRKGKMPVHVHEILTDALSLARRQLEKDGIVLRVGISDGLPQITANPQQVEQVFLNLINNARYALNVKYPVPEDSKILQIQGEVVTLRGQSHIRVTFHDTGVGIPSAIMDKLANPFFSTKPKGVGTGLGLSISYGIVSDHGGELTIESAEGEYTRVHVILPVRGEDEGQNPGDR